MASEADLSKLAPLAERLHVVESIPPSQRPAPVKGGSERRQQRPPKAPKAVRKRRPAEKGRIDERI